MEPPLTIVGGSLWSLKTNWNRKKTRPRAITSIVAIVTSGGAPTRVCSDCNTTKTPLWRSGPQGPKRKARRAMAAAAALTGGLIPAVAPSTVRKEKTSGCQRTVPFKKRCRLTPGRTRTSLLFDEFAISLSKSSALHRVFPQDEKEAALLLMALSSGLIRG
ncbi:unnamed protein product [Spirodela intermedia]|uniref:GATA-type domain-containing protein n=1 Tax=Spirodela intermedia TaxID=51605 RepID=A0A7I8J9N4_SPIIN|nr:unnamed protein product [Spirodela intermedia]CAA6666162.1 unnamed protein product [Spirodela intermedia]